MDQQIRGNVRFDRDTAADIFIQVVESLKDDQGAVLACRKPCSRAHHRLDGLLHPLAAIPVGSAQEGARTADAFESAANFRRKDDRDGNHHRG